MGLFDGISSIFTPVGQPAEQTQATVNGPQQPDLATRWKSWASKPENAAALMQTGIAMLQPLQVGQNTLGSIASSVGQGFEARDRVLANENDMAQQALVNKQNEAKLADMQANSASDRKYKKELGLSTLMNGAKSKGKTPLTSGESYQAFFQKMALANQNSITPLNPQELKAQVDTQWTGMQAMPGAGGASTNLAPDGAPAYQGADVGSPLPQGTPRPDIVAKVQALQAKKVPSDTIAAALVKMGLDPGTYMGN